MRTRAQFANALAQVFLATDWKGPALTVAGRTLLASDPEVDMPALVLDVVRSSVTPYAPPTRALSRLIREAEGFERLFAQRKGRAEIAPTLAPAGMGALPALREVSVPALETPAGLADWLEIPQRRLDWYADVAGRLAQAEAGPLQHYRCAWVPKRRGPPRLIEAPKAELKRMQRQILREILNPLPAHDGAHGFRKGRSCLSYAQQHAGERLVIALDLKDFFLSVPLKRVHGLYRCLGYPWPVARLLTGLCSTTTPAAVLARLPAAAQPDWQTRVRYQTPHLPQGAPTSPALANLASWRLDCRLSGLARRCNGRYGRYADDLAFSGDAAFAESARALIGCVAAIARDEGFALNRDKIRLMGQAQRQRLTGLTVNQHVNLPRPRYETLKATLHNCVRFGPAGQNRAGHADFRGHLNGLVTWAENVNPRRGHKLRLLLNEIAWP